MAGWNCHKKNSWHLPDKEHTGRPIPHCNGVPVSGFSSLHYLVSDNACLNRQKKQTVAVGTAVILYIDVAAVRSQTTNVKSFRQGQFSDLGLSK